MPTKKQLDYQNILILGDDYRRLKEAKKQTGVPILHLVSKAINLLLSTHKRKEHNA